QPGEGTREAAGLPGEVCSEVLDEIHLIDVALRDRCAHDVHGIRVLVLPPAHAPRPDGVVAGTRRSRAGAFDAIRNRRQRTRLWRHRRARAAEMTRRAIANVDVGDHTVATEEAFRLERRLELSERCELDSHAHTVCAACRSQSTQSSRSATGTRSSAEWT